MKKEGHHLALCAVFMLLLFATGIKADVLYDATTLNTDGGILTDTIWPSLNDGLIMVDDITVPDGGWTIDSLSGYFGTLGAPVADSAYLYLYPKTEEQIDPTSHYTVVPITLTVQNFVDPNTGFDRDVSVLTASGLNLTLTPGDYWIGLVPTSDAYTNCWMAWGSRTVHGDIAMCYDMLAGSWVGLAFWTGPDLMMQIRGTAETDASDTPQNHTDLQLCQNYPNPFNPSTTIRFSMPTAGNASLTIYNLKGQKVKTLIDSRLGQGEHSYRWDGADEHGTKAASGVYLYRLETGTQTATKAMIMLK